jgi:hypothetical protein
MEMNNLGSVSKKPQRLVNLQKYLQKDSSGMEVKMESED